VSRNGRSRYLVVAIILLIGIGFLQNGIDPLYPQFLVKGPSEAKGQRLMLQLPQQFLGLMAVGLREMAAGLLWVRADEFFHSGNYKAVMPLIRLVTWLDPRQIDVYATGAWHLDYNFTDSDERSDRRYIPSAIALLREGIRNNPDNYDLYFELAWTHYHQKIKDEQKAVEWAEKAVKLPAIDPNTGKKIPHPAFLERMLAHLYEKAGRLDDADRQWRLTIAQYEAKYRKKPSYEVAQDLEVARKNYRLFLQRRDWRKTDTKPPIDVGFDVTVKRIAPKVLLITGKANLVPAAAYKNLKSENTTTIPPLAPHMEKDISTHYWRDRAQKRYPEAWRDGTRVDIVLTDLGYKPPELSSFSWEVDDTVTVLVDSARIENGRFKAKIDLSKDPQIYSFKAKKYKLTLSINPLQAPDFIQDRIGWRGEGMTDKRYLDRTTLPGVNMIKWEKVFDREELT